MTAPNDPLREALEKIVARLGGPSDARLWDIRQIATAALSLPPQPEGEEAVATVSEFKNELGNTIRITIEGPTSKSTNDLTSVETMHLNKALTKHFKCALELNEQELAVIAELSTYHQLSKIQTLRQALRLYQLHDRRIRDGETLTWSGDSQRARDFVGPVAWRVRHINDPSHTWHYQQHPVGDHNEYLAVEPLYAHPEARNGVVEALAIAEKALERCDEYVRFHHRATAWHNDRDAYDTKTKIIEPAFKAIRALKSPPAGGDLARVGEREAINIGSYIDDNTDDGR